MSRVKGDRVEYKELILESQKILQTVAKNQVLIN